MHFFDERKKIETHKMTENFFSFSGLEVVPPKKKERKEKRKFKKNTSDRARAQSRERCSPTKPQALVGQIIQIMTPEQVSANEINYEISLTKGYTATHASKHFHTHTCTHFSVEK